MIKLPQRKFSLLRTLLFVSGAVFTILIIPFAGMAQKANIWYFGENSGLDFNSTPTTAITDENQMISENGSAVLCDSNGDLVMYTNGETLWDADHNVIPNGENLAGSNESTQNALFLAAPDTPGLFYLFTTDQNPPIGPIGLCYTTISVFQNNYEILEKNIPVLSISTEKLTAVRHSNEKDFWVITREFNTDRWHAYLLTSEGLNMNPVISATGVIQTQSGMVDLPVGAVKASPDGSLLATAYYDKEVFELYDFDAATGIISNPRASRQLYKGAYSVEFSPDGTKLFASTYYLTGGGNGSYLFQFNLLSGIDLRVVAPVASSSDYPYRATALQLAPDGLIYVARSDGDSIGVIQSPDRVGLECNFEENFLSLKGRKCGAGLPNVLAEYVRTPILTYTESCQGDTTFFTLTNRAFIDSLRWDFTDYGIPGRFSGELAPYHIFDTSGTFNINVAIYYNGIQHKVSETIVIHPLPQPDLGEDFKLLAGTETELTPGSSFTSYLWNNDAQTDYIAISDSGMYAVTVTNEFGCINSDTIKVSLADIRCPGAFSPNGDGLNDVFLPWFPDKGFEKYRLLIYSRNGQQIFESNDPDIGWDGTCDGEKCPEGVYIYRILISCRNCNTKSMYDMFSGSVVLINP